MGVLLCLSYSSFLVKMNTRIQNRLLGMDFLADKIVYIDQARAMSILSRVAASGSTRREQEK